MMGTKSKVRSTGIKAWQRLLAINRGHAYRRPLARRSYGRTSRK